jgi:hypothetical protein
MAQAGEGWFDDGSGELRWWDGVRWTSYFFDAATGAVVDRGPAQPRPAAVEVIPAKPDAPGVNVKAAVITFSVIVVVILATWGPAALLLIAGLAVGAVGLYSVLKGSLGRLRITTRPVGVAVLVAGVLASSLGGAALAANNPPTQDVATFVDTDAKGQREASSPPTSTPTPTPVREETIVEERAPISYSSSTVEDPNLDVGNTAVATPGANGEKVTRIRVVTEEGREISREVIEELVVLPPVNEVIAIGTRQPPPPPPAPADNGCDSNYDGACVPIAPDVDCAEGSGNGPAYVDGPVWIVGSDIYDLDRDGDGIACDA